MDVVDRSEYFFIQLKALAVEVAFKLIHRGGANNIAGQETTRVHKCQCHLGGIQVMLPGQLNVRLCCSFCFWRGIAFKPLIERQAPFRWLRTIKILT